MSKPFVIGITGGSGSGKTYFLQRLAQGFTPQQVCLISQDHYYRSREQQPVDENGVKNFDLPVSIDQSALQADLQQLIAGHRVRKQTYTFNNPASDSEEIEFLPAPVLVVEGLFVQYFPEIRALLDLRIFIEAKDHLKLGRRIRRDQVERGYDLDDVLYRYQHHVMPVYETLIEPLKHQSDFVIPNNLKIDAAAAVLAGFIRSILAGKA
ncbi:MAG: uridine kinase [Bacteroidota bacterium]